MTHQTTCQPKYGQTPYVLIRESNRPRSALRLGAEKKDKSIVTTHEATPFAAIGSPACAGSGGQATLIDLSRALKSAGANVAYVSDHGTWAHRLAARLSPAGVANCDSSATILQWKRLSRATLPHDFRGSADPGWPRKQIARIAVNALDFGEHWLRMPRINPKNALVTVGIDPAQQAQFFPNAKPIANHAGSPSQIMQSLRPGGSEQEQKQAYRTLMKRYFGVLFQAQSHATDAISLGAVMPDRAIVLRPSCNESELIDALRENSPFPGNRRAILYVGSLQARKDQATAMHAFARAATVWGDIDLHLVGAGVASAYGAELRALSAQLNIAERVFFWGHRNDVPRFMVWAALILQTSRDEGVSRTLREAAFLGKPIVASDLSGTKELLGSNGAWLCGVGNHEEIGAAILRALASQESGQRSALARTRYLALWSWEKYCVNVSSLASQWNLVK